MKVEINGKQITNYQLTEKGIIIPNSEIEAIQPVFGSIAVAYYCSSEEGDKKWKVQIGNKKLAKVLGKEHLAWFSKREDCKKFISELDSYLRF